MRAQIEQNPGQVASAVISEDPPAKSPVVITVFQEAGGWFVENAGRIGPFFSKKTATDLATDWVAALRASGEPAGMQVIDHFDLPPH